ncbi:MAG: SH3 domain-containing protein [Methylophilaceae bacterium]
MKKICLLLICVPLFAWASEAGTALKADSVRAEPFADAKTTGSINKGDSVDILSKKGAWLQIKSKKSAGWVRLLSVKRGGSSSGNALGGAIDVASGRAGTGKVVSTTGIRGLSAEELKGAKFNEEEMKKMESYAVSASEGDKFANAGGLSKSSMAYFKGAK